MKTKEELLKLLEHNPQPLPKLQERFPRSIKKTLDLSDAKLLDGLKNAVFTSDFVEDHFFDYQDAMRIIASKELIEGSIYLHFSFSGLNEKNSGAQVFEEIDIAVLEKRAEELSGIEDFREPKVLRNHENKHIHLYYRTGS